MNNQKLGKQEKAILMSYAINDMKIERVRREFYYARSTIDYYLAKIYKITGIDPRTFYGLMELVQKVNKGEL
jgi:sugar diacid utilization regulator